MHYIYCRNENSLQLCIHSVFQMLLVDFCVQYSLIREEGYTRIQFWRTLVRTTEVGVMHSLPLYLTNFVFKVRYVKLFKSTTIIFKSLTD